MLANPAYTGTYVYGRYQSCKHISQTGEIRSQLRRMSQDQWRVSLPDHHPGYITWERFIANRQRLQANRTNIEVLAGPAREGLCLLQGLLVCGICGRRLGVRYTDNGGSLSNLPVHLEASRGVGVKRLHERAVEAAHSAIAERVVAAVTPLTIKLALEALTSLEERDQAIAAQWRRRIERAHYEADLAKRRYEAVDSHNRLIASRAALGTMRHNACSNLRPSSPTSSVRRCAPSPPNKSSRSCSWLATSHDCGPLRRPKLAIASACSAC